MAEYTFKLKENFLFTKEIAPMVLEFPQPKKNPNFALQLKKAFSILMALIFLVSASGFSFSVDYCNMKKKASLSLKEGKSCCCKKKSMKSCCENTKVVIQKIKDNYTGSALSKISPKVLVCLGTPSLQLLPIINTPGQSLLIACDKAPPDQPVPLSILYRSILI